MFFPSLSFFFGIVLLLGFGGDLRGLSWEGRLEISVEFSLIDILKPHC